MATQTIKMRFKNVCVDPYQVQDNGRSTPTTHYNTKLCYHKTRNLNMSNDLYFPVIQVVLNFTSMKCCEILNFTHVKCFEIVSHRLEPV